MNRKPIIFALISLAAYLALWVIVPHSRFLVSSRNATLNLISIFTMITLFIGVQIAIVRWSAAVDVRPRVSIAGMFICIAAFAVMVWVVGGSLASDPPGWMLEVMGLKRQQFDKLPAIVKYLSAFGAGAGSWSLVAALLVMAISICLGYTLSFLFREKNIILPVAVFAGYTDLWTVMWGPTSAAIKKAPAVVQAVSAAIPAPGAGTIQPISFIGPGDFIFMAMFFAALTRLKMEPSKTYWLLFPMMSLGMIAVMMNVFSLGLPALILVAIAVIVANRQHFKLQRQEIISTVVVAVILIAAAVAAYPYLTQKQ